MRTICGQYACAQIEHPGTAEQAFAIHLVLEKTMLDQHLADAVNGGYGQSDRFCDLRGVDRQVGINHGFDNAEDSQKRSALVPACLRSPGHSADLNRLPISIDNMKNYKPDPLLPSGWAAEGEEAVPKGVHDAFTHHVRVHG